MDVPILVCGCGMRVKAPGARPGRVGRCPACGGRLEMPDIPSPAERVVGRTAARGRDDGFGPPGEIVLQTSRSSPGKPKEKPERRREASVPINSKPPMADGLLPLLSKPETRWIDSFLYPLRGAESMGVIAAIGGIAWVFTVLVPEYCIQAMSDASMMGASFMGMLVGLISLLPVIILSPFVVSYWLQYLGRGLVTSARGDCAPPRTPDRNFDGFFNGLSPWFIWLFLGLGVGLLPAIGLGVYGNSEGGITRVALTLALAALGLPYILAALMLSFLHDDPLAAMPWGVVLGLVRLGSSFLLLCGLIAASLGLGAGCFLLALLVRPHAFWVYLLLCLPCWIILLSVLLVIVRLLGLFYFHHKDVLRWHRSHPRWGVAWRL